MSDFDPILDEDKIAKDGGQERRLHLKAFNYWRQLRGDEVRPRFNQLTVDGLSPYRNNSLLVERIVPEDGNLDQERTITVRFFGVELATFFNRRPTVGDNLRNFADSGFAQELLSLLDNKSAAERAAEFEYGDENVDSRGIMLPLSRAGGGEADFLWVVMSAKTAEDDADTPVPDVVSAPVISETPKELPPSEEQVAIETEISPEPVASDVTVETATETDMSSGAVESENQPVLSQEDGAVDMIRTLSAVRSTAAEHQSATTPGFERLYGLLSDALRLIEDAEQNPATLERLLEAEGLKVQKRAPYTPVLKLIFGKDYDKTRLTEYGAAIAHGVRHGVTSDGLVEFLSGMSGGIKGCVKAERAAKRGDKRTTQHSRQKTARQKLRQVPAVQLDELSSTKEFDLILVRRGSTGNIEPIGLVDVGESTMSAVIEKQARRHRRK